MFLVYSVYWSCLYVWFEAVSFFFSFPDSFCCLFGVVESCWFWLCMVLYGWFPPIGSVWLVPIGISVWLVLWCWLCLVGSDWLVLSVSSSCFWSVHYHTDYFFTRCFVMYSLLPFFVVVVQIPVLSGRFCLVYFVWLVLCVLLSGSVCLLSFFIV